MMGRLADHIAYKCSPSCYCWKTFVKVIFGKGVKLSFKVLAPSRASRSNFGKRCNIFLLHRLLRENR